MRLLDMVSSPDFFGPFADVYEENSLVLLLLLLFFIIAVIVTISVLIIKKKIKQNPEQNENSHDDTE